MIWVQKKDSKLVSKSHMTPIISILVCLLSVNCVRGNLWVESPPIIPRNATGGLMGSWGAIQNCPLGSFVNGYQMKIGTLGLSGLALQCSQLDSRDEIEETGVIATGRLPPIEYKLKSFATSFTFQEWTEPDGHTFLGLYQLRFAGGGYQQDSLLAVPSGSTNVKRFDTSCPFNWAICGLQARRVDDGDITMEGNRTLTKLRVKCCYYCVPEEVQMIIRDITNDSPSDMTTQISKSLGIHIEKGTQEGAQNGESLDSSKDDSLMKNRDVSSTNSENRHESTNEVDMEGESTNENSQSVSGQSEGEGSNLSENMQASSNTGSDTRFSSTRSQGSHRDFSNRKTSTMGQGTNSQSQKTSSLATDSSISGGRGGSTGSSSGSHTETGVGGNFGIGFGPISAGVQANHGWGTSKKSNKEDHWSANQNLGNRQVQDSGQTSGHHFDTSRANEEAENSGTSDQFGSTRDRGDHKSLSNSVGSGFDRSKNRQRHKSSHMGRDSGRSKSLSRGSNAGVDFGSVQNERESIQAMLATRYGQSFSTGFNWGNSESSMWQDDKNEVDFFVCEAGHRCILKQLVGKCGQVEFYTPKLIKTSRPIDKKIDTENAQYEEGGAVVAPQKQQIWIEVNATVMTEDMATDIDGLDVCPLGSFVTGTHLQFLETEPTTLTGVTMKCSMVNQFDKFSKVGEIETGTPTTGLGKVKTIGQKNDQSPVLGFSHVSYTLGESSEEKHTFIHEEDSDWALKLKIPEDAMMVTSSTVVCPDNFAVCGVGSVAAENQDKIQKLLLKCCYRCQPKEKMVVLHSLTNSGGSDTTHNVKYSFGTKQNGLDNLAGLMGELAAVFSARFKTLSKTTFQWAQLPDSFWTEDEMIVDTFTYACPTKHFCTLRQLTASCGAVEIYTNHLVIESFPLSKP